MNETQEILADAIRKHGPLTTLELFRLTGMTREKIRRNLTEEFFTFEWEAGIRGKVKRWS